MERPAPYAPTARALRVAAGFKVLAGITFVLLVFGATVRVHGAGLACPDWPLCFGEVVPQLDFQVFLEWGHRVLAGSVSIGFLGLGIAVLGDAGLRGRAGVLYGVAVAALAAQVVLGGLTVLHFLAFWSVTLHLLFGNLFCALLLSIALRLGPAPAAEPVAPAVRALVLLSGGMWIVQMALGGLVSSNYAGLACSEWPTCSDGVWFPTLEGIVGLQLLHRMGAYLLVVLVGALAVVGRRDPGAGRLVVGAGLLVLAQLVVGITNVLLALPVEIAILHSALADGIGVVLVVTAWRVLPRPVAASAPTSAAGASPVEAR